MSSLSETKSKAANMAPGGHYRYTVRMFVEDFPQFRDAHARNRCVIPRGVIDTFIAAARDALQPPRWGAKWRYATGLYVAHMSAMYLATYAPEGAKPAEIAKSGQSSGLLTSMTFGDVSVSYDRAIMTEATKTWGAWNATVYGQQLVTEARLIGMGGAFVI
jgi:hypothetical protein